jgi:hypothetical protein
MAWITRRHGEIYEANQGWDRSFETLVGRSAKISNAISIPRWSTAGSPR